MPYRNTIFATGEYYHIFNRGVARQPIFQTKRDYDRLVFTLSYYRFADVPVRLSKLLLLEKEERRKILSDLFDAKHATVEIVAYCLMPNHYHLLVRQLEEQGISTYLRLAINSYARYFNTKNERVGSLFQGVFKAVRIETEEQLLHVSRYIHLNPLVAYLVSSGNIVSYPWSSLAAYCNPNQRDMVVPDVILSHFKGEGKYLEFMKDQERYAKDLKQIEHLMLDLRS